MTTGGGDPRLATDLENVLLQTSGLWEELRGQRLFITGGTGFFGRWLLESFAYANDSLNLSASALVLTRNVEGFSHTVPHLAAHPAISFHHGDVRDFIFPDGEFSHVIHAAATPASVTFSEGNPLETFDVIVEGTRHVLDFAVHSRAGKFLFTSSGAVYGRQPDDMSHIPESFCGVSDSVDPSAFLGVSKRAAECLCALYGKQHSLQVKIARCFSFVGPGLPLDVHYAIGNFIRDVLAGRPLLIRGDGTPCRSYLYSADLATWLWTILFRGTSLRAYNVGAEDGLSIGALAEMVARSASPPAPVVVAGQRIGGVDRYIPSTQRAQTELGLRQTIDLQNAIRKTLAFVTSNSSPKSEF